MRVGRDGKMRKLHLNASYKCVSRVLSFSLHAIFLARGWACDFPSPGFFVEFNAGQLFAFPGRGGGLLFGSLFSGVGPAARVIALFLRIRADCINILGRLSSGHGNSPRKIIEWTRIMFYVERANDFAGMKMFQA